MKQLIYLSTLKLFLCLSLNSFAQVNAYTFSQSSGTYTEITGDTTVAYATGTAISTPQSLDDVIYPNNSLPFSFIFNGTAYTNVVISSNGFITFGGLHPIPTNFFPISATPTYSGAFSAFGNDIIGTRGLTGSSIFGSNVVRNVTFAQFVGLETGRVITGSGIPIGTTITALNPSQGTITLSAMAQMNWSTFTLIIATGSIVRGTTGVIGSRIHTIQFRNVRNFTGTGVDANCINFQIKLFETSNVFEIVYGNNSASVNRTGQVGLRGATNADFNNRTTSTNWATTTVGGTNSATCLMASTVLPDSGLTFRWSPQSSVLSLNLTVFIQGFYQTSSNTTVEDTVVAYLRNSLSPFDKVDSSKAFLSSIGTAVFSFANAQNGVNYYIHVKHRNSIETWSSFGQSFANSLLTYNFSTENTQAYGNNIIQVDASPVRFAIYSGDVNQDGTVDLADGSLIDNDSYIFATGFVKTDLNGDNFVDVTDATLADNNIYNFVSKITPLGSEPQTLIDQNNTKKNQNEQRNNKDADIKIEGKNKK